MVVRFAQDEIGESTRMTNAKRIDFLGNYSVAYKSEVFLKEVGFDECYPISEWEDPGSMVYIILESRY